MNKKIGIIVLVCLLCGALMGGIGVFLYQDNKAVQEAKGSNNTGEGSNLADGEVFDFEEAGYLTLGEYKGLTADVTPDDEDVYYEMIAVADEKKADNGGKVGTGDLVNVDFTAKKDGEEIEDASGEDTCILIGKGEYLDDFENGIIGMKSGKKKTIDCTFPADYDDEELAGQIIQFTIKVNTRFGDDTAEKVSDGTYKTVQEYYEYEKQLQLEDNRENKGEFVWDTLKEECEVESVPEDMLTRAQEDVTTMYTNFAELNGSTVAELLESFGMDEDGLAEIAQDTAIDYMISKTIAAKEGIVMDDEYYQQALMEMLGYVDGDEGSTLSEMEEEYKESQGSRPKDDMLIERIRDYVGENAKEESE